MPNSNEKKHRLLLYRNLILCGAACLIVALALCFALSEADRTAGSAEMPPATAENAVPADATPAASAENASPENAAPENSYSAADKLVMAAANSNATKDAPQITDPTTWNERGKEIMTSLCADPYYQEFGMTLAAQTGFPYLLAVNRAASTVTVYIMDADGNYTVPFMAMVCSGGTDTPTGYWNTPVQYDWRLLSGPCYGQYATRIWDAYLFHSVPYYTQHQDDLEYDEFNQLGTVASLGCIRLAVVDVKWIYDNCPIGTPVVIYDDEANPGPMGKPGTIAIDPADETLRGWDPTDPNPENPWPQQYRTGTAIRSETAWEQRTANTANWKESINPSNLQGWSHDSATEGTRG